MSKSLYLGFGNNFRGGSSAGRQIEDTGEDFGDNKGILLSLKKLTQSFRHYIEFP